jgi:hypothetical protein
MYSIFRRYTMKPDDMTVSELLGVLESSISAALREIKKARHGYTPELGPISENRSHKSTSRIKIAREVLLSTGHPLHIHEIVQGLRDQGVVTTRDSLVSAITKLLAPRGPFVRTAPNTFGLKEWNR